MSKFETTITVEKMSDAELSSQELLRQNLKDSVIEKAMKGRDLRKSVKIVKDKFVYSCKVCKKKFQEKTHYKDHILIHNGTQNCKICNAQLKCKKYLLRHMRNCHGEKRNKYKCDMCNKTFPYNVRLQNHKRVHTGEKPNKCDVCGKTFNAMYSLKTHMLIHSDAKPFECAFCDYKCRDSSTLRKHQHRHLGLEKLYACKKCDKTYKLKYRLTMHVKEHHLQLDMKKYECKICKKKFNYKKDRNLHHRNVHDRSNEGSCEICGRYLPNVANMGAHLRTHTDARPYQCLFDGCDKRFKCQSDMKRHNIIHYPSKHIKCPRCPSKFSRRTRLNAHIQRIHGRKRTVECDVCGTRFNSKNYLIKHMSTVHMGVFRFECEHCDFYTNMKPALIKHLKAYHSQQDRTCKLCKKEFKSVSFLKIHTMRAHNRNNEKSEEDAVEQVVDEPIKIKEEMIDIEEHDLEEVLRRAEVVNEEDITIPALQTDNGIAENFTTQDVSDEIKNKLEELKDSENDADEVINNGDAKMVATKKPAKLRAENSERVKDRARRDINQQLTSARMGKAVEILEQTRQEYNETLIRRAEQRTQEKASKTTEKTKLVLYKSKGTSQETLTAPEHNSSDENDTCDNSGDEIERTHDEAKNSKITFKTFQCYVCFKLFENKEKLVEHCQEHFDICNKKLLKKCPFCPYVTSSHLPRHVSLVHKVKIKTAYNKLIKKGDLNYVVGIQEKGKTAVARDVHEIDVIPSVVNLNRQEYLRIDRQKREFKSKETLKSRLVKKGGEWLVSREAVRIDYEQYLLKELDEASVRKICVTSEDDYVERLVKLKLAATRQGQKMLSPCDLCEKICTNMAALKAHRKSHEKRERVRRVKKIGKSPAVKMTDANQNLLEFYKNNVGGPDDEFEQFVKIFQEINKVGDDKMEVLVNNKSFGLDSDGGAKRRSSGRVKCDVRRYRNAI